MRYSNKVDPCGALIYPTAQQKAAFLKFMGSAFSSDKPNERRIPSPDRCFIKVPEEIPTGRHSKRVPDTFPVFEMWHLLWLK
jgi:hypothetical protein